MKTFIFRNSTIENLFVKLNPTYSGYGDILFPQEEYDRFFWFYTLPFKVSTADLVNEINDYIQKLELVLLKKDATCPLYCFTLQQSANQIKWVNQDTTLQEAIFNYNQTLYHLAQTNSSIKVIDIDDFFKSNNIVDNLDWRFFYTSLTTISPRLGNDFYQWFLKKENAINKKRKKCLVLDLDNTMWGGILGEDGIKGIQLGDTYPGNVFVDFQKCVIEASKNGVILAVCSKNNEKDVLEAWEKHPFMQISKKHISSYRINWQDKATNIMEIAEELNIGLDSLVFIDDNPNEREQVKFLLPQVTVPDFPKRTFELISFFDKVYQDNFQVYSLTEEDRKKTSQYAQNVERKKFQQSFRDIEEYYASLQMKLTVYHNDNLLIPRLSQMTQKTNQFNLTTKRYTEQDIKRYMEDGFVFALQVEDKFGDNGIVALVIVTKENEKIAVIDSFLLSCRILGRDIEYAFLSYIYNFLFDKGFEEIKASYIPSAKNQKLTSSFFDKCGFETILETEEKEKFYQVKIDKKRDIKDYYQFNVSSK